MNDFKALQRCFMNFGRSSNVRKPKLKIFPRAPQLCNLTRKKAMEKNNSVLSENMSNMETKLQELSSIYEGEPKGNIYYGTTRTIDQFKTLF